MFRLTLAVLAVVLTTTRSDSYSYDDGEDEELANYDDGEYWNPGSDDSMITDDEESGNACQWTPKHACVGSIIVDIAKSKSECLKACDANSKCQCVTWLNKAATKKCRLETGPGHTNRNNNAYEAMTMKFYKAQCKPPQIQHTFAPPKYTDGKPICSSPNDKRRPPAVEATAYCVLQKFTKAINFQLTHTRVQCWAYYQNRWKFDKGGDPAHFKSITCVKPGGQHTAALSNYKAQLAQEIAAENQRYEKRNTELNNQQNNALSTFNSANTHASTTYTNAMTKLNADAKKYWDQYVKELDEALITLAQKKKQIAAALAGKNSATKAQADQLQKNYESALNAAHSAYSTTLKKIAAARVDNLKLRHVTHLQSRQKFHQSIFQKHQFVV